MRGRGENQGARRIGLPSPALGLGRDSAWLFWGMFLWEFGFGLYAYLLTLYMVSLGASALQIGLLLGGQGLLRIAVYLPAGIIADRFSRRLIIILTTLITAPAVVSLGVAQRWWQLLPGLLIIVVGNLGVPALSSYIAEAGAANRARAFAMIYTVGPSGALIIAPATGGWIAEAVSLRALFFASGAAYLLATAAFARISERPRLEQAGPAASYREALQVPVVRAVGLLQFGVLGALGVGTTLLPNYLQDEHGISLATVGRFGSIAAIGSVLLSLAVGRVAWMTAIRAIGLATLAVGVLCTVTLVTGNPWLLGVAFLGRGGFMVAWALFAAVVSETTPARLQNRAFAIAELLGSVGFGLAPFVAGALYDWRHGAPLLVTVVTAPLLAAAALWMERRLIRPAMAERTAEAARLAEQPPVTGPAAGRVG